ncbi:MAG: hypothetical protein IPI32_07290 [Austwickia sp.]|nr:hypothetical protein [Austwickia sp.]
MTVPRAPRLRYTEARSGNARWFNTAGVRQGRRPLPEFWSLPRRQSM